MAQRYSSSSSGYTNGYGASGQRPSSFCSGYGSGYSSPLYSPTFKYAQSPLHSPPASPTSTGYHSDLSSPNPGTHAMRLYDVNPGHHHYDHEHEYDHSMEFHQAPDTFPCGHALCHNCLRRLMRSTGSALGTRCPVCSEEISGEEASLAAMGLSREHQEEAPVSLLTNFDEIVKKFNGITYNLRRLKDESVQVRSMGMTYTNTVCHKCRESHPTLRVIQEQNQLSVVHERPNAWSNYFYRLQQGKVITTFYSKVNSSTICVPCTYRELQESKAILPAELQNLPEVDPSKNQSLVLAEVGKIIAKSTAPLMVLRGKNVIEVDHKVRMRERADHFCFTDTVEQIKTSVQHQEENLLRMATKQVRDTGRVYHVQERHEMDFDLDETTV